MRAKKTSLDQLERQTTQLSNMLNRKVDFGKAVNQQQTVSHARIIKMKKTLDQAFDALLVAEQQQAGEQMLSKLTPLLDMTDGNVDELIARLRQTQSPQQG